MLIRGLPSLAEKFRSPLSLTAESPVRWRLPMSSMLHGTPDIKWHLPYYEEYLAARQY